MRNTTSVVLVVGPPSSGKRALVQALVQCLQPPDGSETAPCCPSSTEGRVDPSDIVEESSDSKHAPASALPVREVTIAQADATFDVYPISIKTKYYSAQVALWRQAQAIPILALRSVEMGELEGIIIVFDLTEICGLCLECGMQRCVGTRQKIGQDIRDRCCRLDNGLDQAMEWETFVDAKECCSFRVCVGSKADLLPAESRNDGGSPALGFGGGERITDDRLRGLEERRKRCLEWCLDHGFEYVEADCRDANKGGELREKEGVPRVVEALQSNVWSGMDFSTANRPSGSGASVTMPPRWSSSAFGGEMGAASHETVNPSGFVGDARVSEYLEGFVDMSDELTGGVRLGYGTLDSDSEGTEGLENDRINAWGYGALDNDRDGENDDRDSRTDEVEGKGFSMVGPDGDAASSSRVEGEHNEEEEAPVAVESSGAESGRSVDATRLELKARSEGGATGDGETSGEITQQVAVYLEMREVGDEPEPAPTDGGGASPNTDRNDTDDNHTSVDDDMTLNEGDGRCPNGNAGDTGVTFERPGTGEMSKTTEPHDGFKAEVSRVEGTNKPLAGEGVRASEGIGNLNLDDDVVKSEERVLEAVGAMVSALGADADADEDEMDRLMSEVRKAREFGTKLPDEQRRARAADIAMKLAALLGEDDDEDDDSYR